MIRTSFLVMAFALATSSVSAMPLVPRASIAAADDVVNVKIICSEDGYCYQRGRRPVARWVYGEKNFPALTLGLVFTVIQTTAGGGGCSRDWANP